jgi:DNA-binding NtrC family response regulator
VNRFCSAGMHEIPQEEQVFVVVKRDPLSLTVMCETHLYREFNESADLTLKEATRLVIRKAIERYGSVQKAAQVLGVSRTTLYRRAGARSRAVPPKPRRLLTASAPGRSVSMQEAVRTQ